MKYCGFYAAIDLPSGCLEALLRRLPLRRAHRALITANKQRPEGRCLFVRELTLLLWRWYLS